MVKFGTKLALTTSYPLEISVIKDITDEVCYILPLDRQLIPEPRDLWEFINGILTNEYVLDADTIQSEYEVVRPAIDSEDVLSKYGSYISEVCGNYQTYKLRVRTQEEITTTTARSFIIQRKFIMYPGGQAMITYVIYK